MQFEQFEPAATEAAPSDEATTPPAPTVTTCAACKQPITDAYFGQGASGSPDQQKIDKAKAVLSEEVAYFARELKGAFFGGASVDALDLVLYPWLGGYVKRIAFRKPESKLMALIPAPIAEWCQRVEALPYFSKTIPEHWREGWGKEAK